MTDKRRPPHLTERALAEQEARRAREAEALRANLRRRKAQSQAREGDAPRASPDLPDSREVG